MRHRKTISILLVLLFCHLTLAFLFRAQITHAQSPSPHIDSDLIDYAVLPGDYLEAGFLLKDFPCNDQNNDNDCGLS